MGKVIITVTCDWDGLDYPLYTPHNPTRQPHFRFDHGLEAIQYLHTLFEHRIPLTHFICPVYFTRSQALAEYYASRILQLRKNRHDEIGLHIHGWISLMRACGVVPRDPVQDHALPDWGAHAGDRYGLSVPYKNDGGAEQIDYGHGVPMGVYQPEEILQMVENSRALLVQHQLLAAREDCHSFRCGGWMANDAVLTALQLATPAFQYEASAVDASFFAKDSGTLNAWLAQLWGATRQVEKSYLTNRIFLSAYPDGINIFAQSNEVTAAQPRMLQKLLELPDTAILADYVTADYMKDQIDRAVAQATAQAAEVYVSLGFHLESGGDPRFGTHFGHIERVVEALKYVDQKYRATGDIQYLTIAEAGQCFLQNSTPSATAE